MESPRVRGVLNLYGKRAVTEMAQILRAADKDASGRLIRSLRYEVVEAAEELWLLVEAADYGAYVDAGRLPGKMPPVSKIREWTKLRGIPEKAAWPIARNIGRFGIKPTPFWHVTLDNLDQRMAADLEKAATLDLEAAIRKDLKELSKS